MMKVTLPVTTWRTPLRPSVLLLLLASWNAVAADVEFEKQIAPLIEQHCIRCHSPGNNKGELSLATIDDLVAAEHIVSGRPDESRLIEVLVASGGDIPEMPKESKPLAESEVALLRQWIAEGARWPKNLVITQKSQADASWWSLRPRATFSHDENPEEQPSIDSFIDQKLGEKQLSRNSQADRTTLIRRATYDLIGLPPTPQEIAEFVADTDPMAYEQLIDRLLASPHYGEHWGRHWLDVVRFGESIGFERNEIVNNIWPFRDYVIHSINEDKPFNQFIRQHLAGDVLGPGRLDVEVGSAFLVAGPYDDVGNQDAVQAAQIRANTIDEIIRATSEAFLGLTIGCARCHDHKFDPILQQDYYSWYATFDGIRHGSRTMATEEQRANHQSKVDPLENRRVELETARDEIMKSAEARGLERIAEYESKWHREPPNRQGTEEKFSPVVAQFVRLVSEGNDTNLRNTRTFGIDEFEIWSTKQKDGEETDRSLNVALQSQGAKATGPSRTIEDFPGAYGPLKAIDGKTGERFLANGGHLTIQLAEPTLIDRVLFSSARDAVKPSQGKFAFVAEYRIEISSDGNTWTEVANSHNRKPVSDSHRDHRLRTLELTNRDKRELSQINKQLAAIKKQLNAIPDLPNIWLGKRDMGQSKGPFHLFLGGSPQKKGNEVFPASLAVFTASKSAANGTDQPSGNVASIARQAYSLKTNGNESERRVALANWIVHPSNPLTARVLANRIWHYHFGTGIVDTPNDFGYMGGKPTHPELLDWLADQVIGSGWRLKPIHKLIMMSKTYRQSSKSRSDAVRIDSGSRLLWRFPPRRLAAEEIRDTLLCVAGKLKPSEKTLTSNGDRAAAALSYSRVPDGGPGFRLYRYLQDNVSTYVPLDEYGPETYRRSVYHQNARASIVDLMTDFDQPDCAFSAPERATTTTPLQALTLLNHRFTFDMAEAFAARIHDDVGNDLNQQIGRAYQLCFARAPTELEIRECQKLVTDHGLRALCRVLFNTSELISIR